MRLKLKLTRTQKPKVTWSSSYWDKIVDTSYSLRTGVDSENKISLGNRIKWMIKHRDKNNKTPPKEYVVNEMRNKCALLCQAGVNGIGSWPWLWRTVGQTGWRSSTIQTALDVEIISCEQRRLIYLYETTATTMGSNEWVGLHITDKNWPIIIRPRLLVPATRSGQAS